VSTGKELLTFLEEGAAPILGPDSQFSLDGCCTLMTATATSSETLVSTTSRQGVSWQSTGLVICTALIN